MISPFATRLIPYCLCGLMIALGNAQAWAHENTRRAYVASVDAKDAEEHEHRESSSAEKCRLTIRLVDAEKETPVGGLVRITSSDGKPLQLEGLFNRGTMLSKRHPGKQWYVVLEPATVSVPRGKLTVEAFSGLETETARQMIDLTEKKTADITVRLKRFCRPAAEGWISGNTHLHLMKLSRPEADEYLQTICRADGLDLVFVSLLTRQGADRRYISNEYTKEDLHRLSGGGVLFEWAEEHRHNFGPGGEGFGHVMFLDIKRLVEPVSIGPGIMLAGSDSQPIRRGIEEARRNGNTVVWCHNMWGLEDVPNWLAKQLDAHNIFDSGGPTYHDKLGGYEDSYYRFMNVGLRVPFSTGTDWFMFDFSRVYVKLDGPLTVPRWLDALKAGKTFITNGPMLELQVQGQEPGGTINLDRPGTLKVVGRALGRDDFGNLQLVSGGEVAHTVRSRPVNGHFEADMEFDFPVDEPGWVALRIDSENKNAMGRQLFAHTSAVYVKMSGKTVFRPDVAKLLIADMEQAMRTISEKAQFADDHQREEVMQVYRQGIALLRGRLKPEPRQR